MKKTKHIYLGDKVKTKATFKPLIANGERFDPEGKLYEGIIIGKRGKFLQIDFQKELPFTHYLDNQLMSATGCAVEFKHVDNIGTYHSKDKKKQQFVCLMKEIYFETLNKLPSEIKKIEESISNASGDIKNYLQDIMTNERIIEKNNFTIKELYAKRKNISVDTEHIGKQYHKMFINKKIKSVTVLENNVLVTTNDLTYTSETTRPYILGAYKILIPLNDTSIRIINYKKHVQRFEYHHPCIQRGILCLGHLLGSEITKLKQKNDIINITHLLINFLEEPNYNRPHITGQEFRCAQPVTIKPTNEMDWFDREYWSIHESWDGDMYTDALSEL